MRVQTLVTIPGAVGAQPAVPKASSVTRRSFTWTFDTSYPVGQFCNGDWWVVENSVGAGVNITAITPATVTEGGWTKNGSMANPPVISPGFHATGYDSSIGGFTNYQDSANVGKNLPYNAAAGTSIVSVLSAGTAGNVPQLLEAEILTVLAVPPEAGSFRPYYGQGSKAIQFNESQIDLNKLLSLDTTGTTPWGYTSLLSLCERPWIDHIQGWRLQDFAPSTNMENYGRDISVDGSLVTLGLLADHLTNDEKTTLATNFIQVGIDLYGSLLNGETWPADGGHASGRKWPILFAGYMLGHAGMLAIGTNYAESTWGEDCQTFFGAGTPYTLPPSTDGGPNDPRWGIRWCTDPTRTTGATSYGLCCTACSWIGEILAAHALGLKDEWNWDAIFDYIDWYIPWRRGVLGVQFHYTISYTDWPLKMWDLHRSSY